MVESFMVAMAVFDLEFSRNEVLFMLAWLGTWFEKGECGWVFGVCGDGQAQHLYTIPR